MKHKFLLMVIVAVLALSAWASLPAQTAQAAVCAGNTSKYRSAGTGNWAANATWQVSTDGGTTWAAAGCWPSSINGTIQIQNGHNVTVAAAITVDEVTIDAGGTVTVAAGQTWTIANGVGTDLTVNGTVVNAGTMTMTGSGSFGAGSTYQHNQNGGVIPPATWNATSTVLVTGIINTAPTGLGQTFGNLTWNSTGQTGAALALASAFTVAGDLNIVSTGTTPTILRPPDGSAHTVGGNYTQTGGSIRVARNTASSLTVAGSFSLSGGTLILSSGTGIGTLNVAGNFSHTGGTLTETGTGSGSVIFNGAGIQNYTSGGTVSNIINFTVNSGATLYMGISTLTGAGTFTLSAGGTLGIGSPTGITTVGTASGNIQTTGGRVYNAGANYIYNRTTAQNTGTGLPTNLTGILTIMSGNTVTLDNARTIASGGTVNIVAGTFAAGTNLTMATTSSITRSGGAMTGTPQGTGVYNVTYTGNSMTTSAELAGSGLNNITVNLTAGQTLTLDQNRAPDGNLTLTGGTFDLSTFAINRSAAGGTLTLNNGATLKIGGTNTLPSNYSTHSVGATSTIEYAGSAQTVATLNSAQNYGNLTISGSGIKTLAGSITVTGALNLTAGTLAVGSNTLTLNGAVTCVGTFTSVAGGTVAYAQASAGQNVCAGTYGNLTFSNFNKILASSGTIGIAGTFTPGSATGHTITGSTIDFNGTSAQTIPAFNYNHLTDSSTGARTLASSGTIGVAGIFTPGTNTYTISGSTIEYNGTSAQNLPTGFKTYHNLTIKNAAGVGGISGLVVNGLLWVWSGVFTSASDYADVRIDNGGTLALSGDITVGGNWTQIMGGAFTPNNHIVTFDGAGTQTITGTAATPFSYLMVYTGTIVIMPDTNVPTASNTITNYGTLRQTRIVSGAVTSFLNIGTGKYYGVEIDPGSHNLGSITVDIQGNRVCQPTTGLPLKRCYTLSPAGSHPSANIKFYYTQAEMQSGQTFSSLNVWHYNGSTWDAVTRGGDGGSCNSGALNCYVQGNNITSYGSFALMNSNPLAVNLASFSAAWTDNQVVLNWETVSELHNLGFNVWRGSTPTAPLVKLNDLLIPSQAPGGTQGNSYIYTDTAAITGTIDYYWLEDVDLSGQVTRYGPVQATSTGASPTAVRLITFAATAPSDNPAWPLWGAGAIILIGAVVLIRRR